MKVHIKQTSALHEKGSRFKNEDFIYPILDGAQIDGSIAEAIPNIPGLYMVCDGVGGENKGEIASQLAIAHFARYFDTFPPSGQVTYGYLSAALLRVEEAFSNYLEAHPESKGMGTTLALLYVDDHGVTICWTGDSRIYHFRDGKQLYKTRDHSVVNDLIEQGEITEEEARNHPQRKLRLRSIKGTEEPTDLDTHSIPLEGLMPGDILFVCTDGVLEEVSDTELATLFSSSMGVEEIRQEIFTLCKGSSSDNFSCYLVQLGEIDKSGIAPVQEKAEDEEEIILIDSVEEPPQEKVPIEDAAIFDGGEESSEKEGESVFERLGKMKEPTPEAETVSSGKTLFDRISNQAQGGSETPVDPPKTETEQDSPPKKEEESKKETTGAAKAESKPKEESDAVGSILLPVVGVVGLLALLVFFVWYFNRPEPIDPFTHYLNKGQESLDSREFDNAILYADSAFRVSKDDAQKFQADELRVEALNLKEDAFKQLAEKAEFYRKEGGYPGYWKASELYMTMRESFADIAENPDSIENLINLCNAEMDKIPDKTKVKQLMKEADGLCKEGAYQEAGTYYTEATKFTSEDDKMKRDLQNARLSCQELEQIAMKKKEDSIKKASPEQAGQLAEKSPDGSEETSEAKEPIASNETPQKTAAQNPQQPVTRGGDDRLETTDEGSASANYPLGGFMATRDGSPPPTPEQMRYLKDAKALYHKSRSSLSRFEEQKAVSYFTKAGSALDGEAYYMLSQLYHNDHGIERNDDKSLEYASKSANMGYAGGHYQYAMLLLPTGSPMDSLNAKKSLNIAANKGHQAAIDKLSEIQTELTARIGQVSKTSQDGQTDQ